MGSPRNYSHITVSDINAGIKYHVSQDDKNNLAGYLAVINGIVATQTPSVALASVAVGVGATVVMDSFAGTPYFGCEWRIDMIDTTASIVRKSSVLAVWSYHDNTISSDERKVSIGDMAGLSLSATLSSGTVRLSIVNAGSHGWTAAGRRIIT